jgi:uncharacterized protein with GYD domain
LRTRYFSKLLYITAVFLLLLTHAVRGQAVPSEEASQMLPDAVAEFRGRGAAHPYTGALENSLEENYGALSAAVRTYRSAGGLQFEVAIIRTRSDSSAYALLTTFSALAKQSPQEVSPEAIKRADVGTYGYVTPIGMTFFKGAVVVAINPVDERKDVSQELITFASALAEQLDKGENEIPALVKHLPEWETAQSRAVYAVSLPALQQATGRQPVLDTVSFEGGAEAVTASYGPSRLVIVENTTPQLATTNDTRINAKLKELRDAGQSVPTAYRRVGNYSVFVFDAPDEATATKLIESIKYEQVVQWLGPNPYDYQRAVRSYTNTTAGVIVAVLKASGLSLLLCLGVGGIFGAIVFKRRRQQQTVTEAFSDAGGMVRLNLEEITQMEAQGKMVGPGKGR